MSELINRVKQDFSLDKDTAFFLATACVVMLVWKPLDGFIEIRRVDPSIWIASGEPLLPLLLSNSRFHVAVLVGTVVLLTLNYLEFDWNIFHGRVSWKNEPMAYVRYAVGIACLAIAYLYFAADINLYAGRAFTLDRIIILLLSVGVFFNPIFVPFFLLYSSNFNEQYAVPAGLGSFYHIEVAFDFLLLISLYILLQIVFRNRIHFGLVILLGISRIGAIYFISGWAKMFSLGSQAFEWVTSNNITNLAIGAYVGMDWLNFIPQPQATRLFSVLDQLDPMFAIFTILVEVGIIVSLFYSRKVTVAFLIGAIGLHLGIFITAGILFRIYILKHAVFLAILSLQPKDSSQLRQLYALPVFLLSFVFMVFGSHYFPTRTVYAWWDSPVFTVLDYEVTTTEGKTLPLPRTFLTISEDLNRGRYNIIFDFEAPIANSWGGSYYSHSAGQMSEIRI